LVAKELSCALSFDIPMRYALVTSLILFSVSCFGQNSPTDRNSIHFQTQPHGFMTSLPSPPPGQTGDYYLFKEWSQAEIYLKDSTKLSDAKIKVDLKANNIEIIVGPNIKVLPCSRVLAVSMTLPSGGKEELINENFAGIPGSSYNRLLRVVYEGKYILYCRTVAELVLASQSPNPMVTNMTTKDNEVILKRSYILVRGKEFVEISPSKGAFKEGMVKTFGETVEPFVKKTNPKKEDELVALAKELSTI